MNELTRAELLDRICLTDATYDCEQGNRSSSCDKCDDVLNYLLDRYDAKVRADEREKVLDEVDKYLRELSNIKSGCGEWIEHHDAELMRRTREQEMNFVERKCKELGIDYTQIYTCNSAD